MEIFKKVICSGGISKEVLFEHAFNFVNTPDEKRPSFSYRQSDYTSNDWNQIAECIRQADIKHYSCPDTREERTGNAIALPHFCLTLAEEDTSDSKEYIFKPIRVKSLKNVNILTPDAPVSILAENFLQHCEGRLERWECILRQSGYLNKHYDIETHQPIQNVLQYREKMTWKLSNEEVESNPVSFIFQRIMSTLVQLLETYNSADKQSVSRFYCEIEQARDWIIDLKKSFSIYCGKKEKRHLPASKGVRMELDEIEGFLKDMSALIEDDAVIKVNSSYQYILDESYAFNSNMLYFLSIGTHDTFGSWSEFLTIFDEEYVDTSQKDTLSQLPYLNYTKLLVLVDQEIKHLNVPHLNKLMDFFNEPEDGFLHFLKEQGVGHHFSFGTFLSILPFLDISIQEKFKSYILYDTEAPHSFFALCMDFLFSLFGKCYIQKPWANFSQNNTFFDLVLQNLRYVYAVQNIQPYVACLKSGNAMKGLLHTAKNKSSILRLLDQFQHDLSGGEAAIHALRSFVLEDIENTAKQGIQKNAIFSSGNAEKKKRFLNRINLSSLGKIKAQLTSIYNRLDSLNCGQLEKDSQRYIDMSNAYFKRRKLLKKRAGLLSQENFGCKWKKVQKKLLKLDNKLINLVEAEWTRQEAIKSESKNMTQTHLLMKTQAISFTPQKNQIAFQASEKKEKGKDKAFLVSASLLGVASILFCLSLKLYFFVIPIFILTAYFLINYMCSQKKAMPCKAESTRDYKASQTFENNVHLEKVGVKCDEKIKNQPHKEKKNGNI